MVSFDYTARECHCERVWKDGEGGKDSESVTYQYFLPQKPNGTAVVICPGGGYHILCDSYEGTDIAKWLNQFGITGIVLRYRVGSNLNTRPLDDAAKTMLLVRANAEKYGIDPEKIGIAGFSAGGHLASCLAVHCGRYPGSAPNFQILAYPVITMGEKTHNGSRNRFLGENAPASVIQEYSSDLHVSENTCKTFICHAVTDAVVPVDNSRSYVDALRKHGVSVEYLELPSGAHGLGCGNGAEWEAWQAACALWMQKNGIASTAPF